MDEIEIPKKRKKGPVPKTFDKKMFEALLQYGPTRIDMANHFDCSFNTIKNYCRREYQMNFEDLRNLKMGLIRMKLRQKAVGMALQKDDRVMLIFCLKNLCGWSDNPAGDKKIEEDLSEIKENIKRIDYRMKEPVISIAEVPHSATYDN